ncbi:helix-turn-helix transcriptional regulator [Pseudogulbenkiania subflava]|uniref:Predicted transcriptional regulator, ArsR family n=1 Tax=Pseudogulbenkiania subflava DSM 22618 TaxID=1123014 RepID=A0A1Y6C301_9NEIS|nr:HTH domain-containing protein [Pseudogulbenkiania subflava]SMF42997.1 Predicted transcriptional regulator, ArsR family [Pseudogulbenkiania subflava DSM 22618]
MLEAMGERQQQLLRLLQRQSAGLTVEQLAQELAVTRTAVRQHLTVLERDGLVERGMTQPTGGRPEQLFVLTPKGQEVFPRRYSWFAELLLKMLEAKLGQDELAKQLAEIGTTLAATLPPAKANDPEARIRALADIMLELGYDARPEDADSGLPRIVATNCIFHHLAARFPEVCQLDLALMSSYVGEPVTHEECMVRGGACCRFRFTKP